MRATIRATLREVDGRRLVFDIEGHDEVERIVEGTHERFQIDQARFLARIAAKKQPTSTDPTTAAGIRRSGGAGAPARRKPLAAAYRERRRRETRRPTQGPSGSCANGEAARGVRATGGRAAG